MSTHQSRTSDDDSDRRNPFATSDSVSLAPTALSRRDPHKPHPLAAFGVTAGTPQNLLPSPPLTPTSRERSGHTRRDTDATATGSSFLPDLDERESAAHTPAPPRHFDLSSNVMGQRNLGTESPAEEFMVVDISDANHDLEAGYGLDPRPSSLGRSWSGARRSVTIDDHPLGIGEHERPKQRSPQPWEYIEPPVQNNHGFGGTFTTMDTRGFQTLREKPS